MGNASLDEHEKYELYDRIEHLENAIRELQFLIQQRPTISQHIPPGAGRDDWIGLINIEKGTK